MFSQYRVAPVEVEDAAWLVSIYDWPVGCAAFGYPHRSLLRKADGMVNNLVLSCGYRALMLWKVSG